MTVDMEKYEELLQRFGGISQNHIRGEALEELKEKYKKDIPLSKRVLSDIVDINCLLKVLKKRLVLRYDDVKVLKDITNEHVTDEAIKLQITELIAEYEQWLHANFGSINFLYNSGKSNYLLTSHDLNVPKNLLKVSETLYLHNNFDENLQTSTEDMAKESLLTNVSLNNLNIVQNENDTDRNSFLIMSSRKCPLTISRQRVTTVLIFLILICILIGIIWILIKLPREPAAVVPVNPSVPSASGQSQLNMPFYMSNTRAAGYSTQSTFSVNHTQIYATSTVPPIVRERELQKLVVISLSERIGSDWKDVCRGLDIRESAIDEITIEYSQEPAGDRFVKMFKKGMKLYFSEPQPDWERELKNALRLCGRKDLEEKVEKIIRNYSNRSY